MSFRLKTILGIAIIETILLVILVSSSLSFLLSSNEDLFHKRANVTTDLFTTAIKDALISSDIATLESLLEGVKALPEIEYTQVLNSDGTILVEFKSDHYINPLTHFSADQMNSIIHLKRTIVEEGEIYGTVHFGLSTSEIASTVDQAFNWGVTLALLEIILVAIFSYILGTYLTKQLTRLTEASNQVKQHGPGFTIENPGKDEIGQVINAFNQMSTELESTYSEQNENILEYLELHRINQQTIAQNKAVLDASLDAIVTINEFGMIMSFNSAAEKTFGWLADEIIGKNLTETIIPHHFRDTHQQGLDRIRETKKSMVLNQVLQLEALHKDGHVFPIDISISQLSLKNELIFTAFIRDITHRVEAQKELNISAIAIESSDALIITDADHKIIRVNQAYCALTGYKAHEILGQTADIFIAENHLEIDYIQLETSLKNSGSWNGTLVNKNKKGEYYYEHVSVSVVENEQGGVSHYVIHLVDITEIKETENQLRKAQMDAERASLAKSQFLANMSHEIRSPLHSIITVNELLLQSKLPIEEENLVKISLSGGQSLMNIINDILDFSKIEAGEMPLKQSSFNLIQLVEEVIDLFKHTAQEQNIHLTYRLDPELNIFFIGDAVRVKQILTNLVNNAIKFTHQGGVSIHLKNALPKGLIIEVQDTGVGLRKEDTEKVFTEFFQADDSNTKRFEGTGLGLAIVHNLTKLMSGSVSLDSTIGEGSCFKVELPLLPDKDQLITVHNRIHAQPITSEILLISHDAFLHQEMSQQLALFNINILSLEDLSNRTPASDLETPQTLLVLFTPPYDQTLESEFTTLSSKLKQNYQAVILVDPVSNLAISDQHQQVEIMDYPLHFEQLTSLLSLEHHLQNDINPHPTVLSETLVQSLRTILIVEDSKTNQIIAQNMLQKKGYQHDIANNGVEAIDKTQLQKYDLILMDMRMPIMDGIEATKYIRTHAGLNQNTPILAMTANAFVQDEEACAKAGMNDFLTKPIDIQRFYQVIEHWLTQTADVHTADIISEELNTQMKTHAANSQSSTNPFKLSDSAKSFNKPVSEPLSKPRSAPLSEQVFNQETWSCLKKDVGAELLLTILEVYLSETKNRLTTMKTLWQDNQLQPLSNEAHALKSSSGSFGLIELQALAKTIEFSSQESDIKALTEAMDQLEKTTQRALKIISRYLETGDL